MDSVCSSRDERLITNMLQAAARPIMSLVDSMVRAYMRTRPPVPTHARTCARMCMHVRMHMARQVRSTLTAQEYDALTDALASTRFYG